MEPHNRRRSGLPTGENRAGNRRVHWLDPYLNAAARIDAERKAIARNAVALFREIAHELQGAVDAYNHSREDDKVAAQSFEADLLVEIAEKQAWLQVKPDTQSIESSREEARAKLHAAGDGRITIHSKDKEISVDELLRRFLVPILFDREIIEAARGDAQPDDLKEETPSASHA